MLLKLAQGSTPPGGNESSGEPSGEEGGPRRRRPRKLPPSRKIAYSGICTAIAVIMIAVASWLPVTVAPLVLVALSWNVVADKCGIGYAFISMAASVALGFLCSAANIAVLVLIAVAFVPYSLLCMLMRRLDYGNIFRSVVRIICVAAFAALEVLIIYNLGNALIGVNEYVYLGSVISAAAGGNFALGYAIVTLIGIFAFVLVDFVYVFLSRRIITRLK